MSKSTFLALLFLPQFLLAQKATVTEETRNIITYPYSDPDPMPILTEKNYRIYPYNSFDGYSLTGQSQKWKVVKLENDYIEVYVLPESGGKVWGAIEKSTGKEFIYRNEVMKFRNISLRGPWTSGGIEFNFGYIGHSPSTASPVDYKTFENADGSVSCIVGNTDLASRTQWCVEIRLPKDKAYFETHVTWNNPTPLPQSYYNWMTGAAVVTDDLEFFYPGNTELDHDGTAGSWPIDKLGHDLSKYPNNAFGSDRSSHVVGDYSDFMGGYYHSFEFGFGHWALYDDMPGRKLWLWSQARSGAIWKDLLTDTDGQYMEFQAGRTFNQYAPSTTFKSPITQVPFSPGLTDSWNEIWFPVKEIGGLLDVSPSGVLNVIHENGKLTLGINALADANAIITVYSNDKLLLKEEHQFKPMDVFKTSVSLDDTASFEVIAAGMDLRFSSPSKNKLSRPFITTQDLDKSSAAYDFNEGIQQEEARNYKSAKKYFISCLRKDSQYIDAMASLEELYYRSNQYDSALLYADKALQLDAYHPAANYFAGITYRAQGNFIDALETLGWAARSTEYKSTAYAQMAGIELQLGDFSLAEHYSDLSLTYDRNSFKALEILSIVYRLEGKNESSLRICEQLSHVYPINHFADFECYLLSQTETDFQKFSSSISNEFPFQTYLELAIDYYNLGQQNDAIQVLKKAPGQPLIRIWKAYLENNASALQEVAHESPEFVFPYRTETEPVLKWAVSQNSSWKFKYYLGLNYWALQREEDARECFADCKEEPDYAFFYLTRAWLNNTTDKSKELTDLVTGNHLAPENWRTWSKLIDYYENSTDYKTALSLSTQAASKFKGNFNIALQFAKVQFNNKQYSSCIKTLEKTNIIPFEGSIQGKYVYEQAYMKEALDLIKNHKYKDAILKLEKSKEWPENLGVGKPYNPDNRMQDYMEAYCLDKLNRRDEATALRGSIVDETFKNFDFFRPSFTNALVLSILNAKGNSQSAETLISKLEKSKQSDSSISRWVVADYKKDIATCQNLEKEFTGNIYYMIFREILSLEN